MITCWYKIASSSISSIRIVTWTTEGPCCVMHEARELTVAVISIAGALVNIWKRKNTTNIRNLSVDARRHKFSVSVSFFCFKHRLTLTLIGVQIRPRVIITNIWFRFYRFMYKTLSLQPSVVDYKKIYSLRPIFWLESKFTPARKKKKKTKQNKNGEVLLWSSWSLNLR